MPAKHDHVTYEGPTRRDDSSETFGIDGVTLRKGVPTRVENTELLNELKEGSSDRLKGHRFSVGPPPGEPEEPSTPATSS